MLSSRRITLVVCLTAIACGRSDVASSADAGGAVIISTGADADAVLAPLARISVGRIVAEHVYELLADVGDSLNTVGDAGFTPRLAKSWTWSPDSASISFAIDPAARWHDGRPVRSQDVKFSHAVYVDPVIASLAASSLANVDSITTPDSLTAVVWFKQRSPEQFFDFVYNLRVIPEHKLGNIPRDKLASSPEATHPVGSGPFRFVRWERSALIEMEADTNNWRRRRPLLDRVIVSVSTDPTAAVTRVLAGEADFIEVLRGDAVQRIKDNPNAVLLNAPSYDYGAIHWNVRDPSNTKRPHPILGEPALRRALAMGVDRTAIVKSVLDTLGYVTEGPYVRAQSFVDPAQVAFRYDQNAARALLDSLGWKDTNGDSIRERNGRPLELTLVVPVTSPTRVRMSVIMQDQLKQIGVRLKLDQMEHSVMIDRIFGSRKWDGVFMGYHADPGSSAVKQNWGSAGAVPGGSNISLYQNPAFDAQFDSAQTSFDPAARRSHFKRAFEILNNDAPGLWMYELRATMGINKRIRPGTIRPDAWWAHLDKWSIPADLRIARDRVGLAK
ncbi:MAG TPA: peptide ABC transporter substrate-binding protein [Gemmatimonadaceae bacterium]|nr:peptide ABC transporter substrate-binding protein [Gemmatimonadaceae bacterium]